jgi:hypothetical protein
MKFLISRTSDRSGKPVSEAYWDNKLDGWAIRVRGLPTLLGLMVKEDHPIVIALGNPPSIEIYDDYRE